MIDKYAAAHGLNRSEATDMIVSRYHFMLASAIAPELTEEETRWLRHFASGTITRDILDAKQYLRIALFAAIEDSVSIEVVVPKFERDAAVEAKLAGHKKFVQGLLKKVTKLSALQCLTLLEQFEVADVVDVRT